MTVNKGDYAAVNGLELYYEVHGEGEPLILLHGGVGAIEMFGEISGLLAEGMKVVGVDLQAHGRTADVDRPMTFEAMADDVAALIGHLSFGKADVMGYSLSGGVALQTAIRHPEVVRKPVVVSAAFKRDSWYPEILAGMEVPTMIVVGDADSIRRADAVEFFGLLGGGERDAGWDGSGMSDARLAILPGTTHYDIFYSPALAAAVVPFLDSPMPEAG